MKTDVDRLEDRVRSESAQKADLQAGLYEVRGLYAKAIADRESLEARATQAEAEKAAADTNWQRTRAEVSGGCKLHMPQHDTTKTSNGAMFVIICKPSACPPSSLSCICSRSSNAQQDAALLPCELTAKALLHGPAGC